MARNLNYFSRQNTLVLILYRAIISIFFRHSEIFTILILQIPRRRRSCILETLKEYEDLERESPTVTPGIILFFLFFNHECKCSVNFHDFFFQMAGSPCSSEEMNTPLLRRIAQRLFKNNQNAETSTPNDPQESSPVLKETLNQFEISNDG